MTNAYYYYSEEISTAAIIGVLIGSLIAATVFGCVCRYIMKGKGYQSLAGWFCCGFFLGLIGIIICVTRPDLSRPPFQNGNPYGNPYGQPMPPYGQPPMGQPGQPMPPYGQPPMGQPMMNQQPQGIRCNSCGMINVPGTVYCQQCGNKLQ